MFHTNRFAQLCYTLLEDDAETGVHFGKEFLPSLLSLLSDRIPNVRLSVARTLTKILINCGKSLLSLILLACLPACLFDCLLLCVDVDDN